MEQINRIEIQGSIGNIKLQEVGESQVANMSVVTNYVFKTRDGSAGIETMWHNVVVWQNKNIPDLTCFEKGMGVHITGRLRSRNFTGSDGIQHYITEVIANHIEKVDINN